MKSGVYCPSCSKAHELEYEQVMGGFQFQRVGVCPECEVNISAICASVSRDLGGGSADSLEKKRAEYEAMKLELKNAFRVLIKARNGCNDVPVGLRDDVQEAIVRMVQNFIWIEDEP